MNPFLQDTVARPVTVSKPNSQALEHPINLKRPIPSVRSMYFRHPARLFRSLGLAVALAASGSAFAVNVNDASLEQLLTIRGIGPKTAQTIMAERTRGGPYVSFDDLSERVKGIGVKKAIALRAAGLKVEGSESSPRESAVSKRRADVPARQARQGR